MSTKFDSTSAAPKISIFAAAAAAAKSGFVIPKNKLSGSLVPVFPGVQKHGPTNELTSKQFERKTKWGPDLTQDSDVRRGMALALQVRVDQITKQLESEKLDLPLGDDNPDQINSKSEMLELEKREAIGEILKLDPSYKPPPGFKQLLKEATVPLPVQEYPGYNFIALIYGPEGDNQKRIEKETGAKIKVHGTKADTGEKGEIKPGADNKCSYKDMHVIVAADSFDKVDAAVSIIELLITSVTGNLAAGSTPAASVSGDRTNVPSQSVAVSVALENQAIVQPVAVSQMHGNPFQYSGPWFSGFPSHTPPVFASSGYVAVPNPSGLARTPHFPSQTFNPASRASNFGAQPGFHPNIANQHVSMQVPPHMTQASSLGHIGPPRNSSIISLQNSSAPTMSSIPQAMSSVISPAPIPNQSLTPLGLSSGQNGPPFSNMGPPPRPVSLHQQPDVAFKPPQSNMSMMPRPAAFPPHHAGIPSGPRPSSFGPMPPPPTHSSVNRLSGPVSFPLPQQSGMSNSASGVTPYQHTNVKPPVWTTSNSGNFTFHSLQPNSDLQVVSRPNSQATTQGGSQELQPSGPQPSPFGFPNKMDQTRARASAVPFAGRSSSVSIPPRHAGFPYAGQPPVPQMGTKNFISAPQMPNFPNPGVPRSMHIQHNYPALRPWPLNQKFGSNHSMASGRPTYSADQIYDPFSPTSVAPPQHKGNPGK